jgi:hypothetical protein
VPLGDRGGEQRSLGSDLGAGVPGADHDERAPGLTFCGVVAGSGEFDLPDDVVSQVKRFRLPRRSCACVLGDTGATPGIGSSLFTLPAARISRW